MLKTLLYQFTGIVRLPLEGQKDYTLSHFTAERTTSGSKGITHLKREMFKRPMLQSITGWEAPFGLCIY